jgi:uncharacterized protein (TIGR03437 family)
MESITVQVPLEPFAGLTSSTTVPVIITNSDGSTTVDATILPAAPGVFATGDIGPDKRRMAVVIRPDGSVVSDKNALAIGETGRAFVTGLIPPAGLTTNAQSPLDSDIVLTTPLVVGINNSAVPVISVKYARNLVGIWEVEFQVPANAKTGNRVPFVVGVPVNGKLVFSQGTVVHIR